MLGLPFLIGNGCTPSFVHYLESERDDARVRTSGARVMAVCLLAPLGVALLRGLSLHLPHFLSVGPLVFVGHEIWYLQFFLRRYATEQLSVGALRLIGHDVRDDFAPNVLVSQNFVDFWRRWNVLWREFLVSVLYYPIVLRLGRRYGPRRPWIFGVAALGTFLASTFFLVFPDVLFILGARGSGIVLELVVFRLIYHAAWGVLLGANLMLQASRRGRPTPPWLVPIKVVLTFVVTSLARALQPMAHSSLDKIDLAESIW
jgi:hypothetical protein